MIRDFALAFRNLRRNRSRTLVAVISVAGGVIALIIAGGFIAWVLREMREGAIHCHLGHVQIVRPGYFERGIADPYAFLLPTKSSEQETIEATSGVVTVSPRLAFSGLISRGETTLTFSGEGMDPELERPIARDVTIIAGRDLANDEDRAVLLGEGLANSLGAKPGDMVVLLTTTTSGGTGAIELPVAGIIVTVAKEYDDYAVRMPIRLARKLMRVNGATSWVALLQSTEQTSTFVAAMRSALPAGKFQVVPWRDLADFFNKTEALFTKQVRVVEVIIGLIIILTISNTLTMTVLERTTEIGTGLAMGVRRTVVMRLFVMEGLMIGLIGGLVGLLLGYVLAMIISTIGIPMPPPPGMTQGYDAAIIVTPSLAADAVVLAIVTTLIASILPAWRAGHMNIVDALRYGQ